LFLGIKKAVIGRL